MSAESPRTPERKKTGREGWVRSEAKKQRFEDIAALAIEIAAIETPLVFPGIHPDEYAKMKAAEAEDPVGYTTPIDELIARMDEEGVKVVLNPKSGDVFILPAESIDIENDGTFARRLRTSGESDNRLNQLIALTRNSK